MVRIIKIPRMCQTACHEEIMDDGATAVQKPVLKKFSGLPNLPVGAWGCPHEGKSTNRSPDDSHDQCAELRILIPAPHGSIFTGRRAHPAAPLESCQADFLRELGNRQRIPRVI